MQAIKKLTIFVLTMLLMGCSYFFPEYEKPKTNMPENWNSKNSQVTEKAVDLPYLAWWQKFDDPELNNLIQAALIENSSMKLALANIQSAEKKLSAVKLGWLPLVSLFGGYLNGQNDTTVANIGGVGAIAATGGFLAILPSYTINLFRTYARQKQAGFELEVAKANQLNVRLAITSQVVMAYFSYLAQVEAIKTMTQLDKDYSELLEITRNMDQQGLATQISVSDILSQQRMVAGQLAIAKSNIISSQNAIKALLGKAPGSVNYKTKFENINPNQVVPGNLPVNVIASRPDIIQAEAQLKASNAGIKVASSSLLPTVSLNYFYARSKSSVNSTTNENISGKQSTFSAFADWTVSPEMIGNVGVANSYYSAAVIQYQEIVNGALHDVDNALADNEGVKNKMDIDLEAYQAQLTSTSLKEALYQQGLISYEMIIGSEIELLTMQLDLTSTKLEQLATLVKLYGALGGGYLYGTPKDKDKVEEKS
jgi:NodT family efflux transporter outer membrane factor (OMF) lipoprotein